MDLSVEKVLMFVHPRLNIESVAIGRGKNLSAKK